MKRVVFLVSTFIFLVLPTFVSAEITYPYTLDEKPRVLFGDSVPIEVPTLDGISTTTYYGMENYKQDYVGGFVHFSFTYSHHRGSYASFPPLVYITAKDPRTTDKPEEKLIYSVPDAPSLYWYGETDWYLIDIQFDQFGFTFFVKQRGETPIYDTYFSLSDLVPTDWISIANRYPRNAFSDQTNNDYAFSFSPVPIRETQDFVNPVIIIPGIMGSAKKNGELVIDPILHTYDDLIATLVANGYEKEKNLFTFPYEWRDSNVFSARLLKDKIALVKTTCETAKANNQISSEPGETDCSKVDLVAHSMGGLIARQYAQSTNYQNDIDQLIFLGTPHKGAPKAYLQWEAGEFPPGFEGFMAEQFFASEARRNGHESIFDYIRIRPILSVQELLPVTNYLRDKDTGILRTYPNNYPRNAFLESLNSNTDNLLNSGIKITNIIGNTGNNTIENIVVSPTSDPKKWEHGEENGFISGIGDDTVTAFSSRLDSSITDEEFIGVPHDDLPRETSARVFNVLSNKIATDVIYLSLVEKIFSIQLQSPIDVVVTAPDGKKIGKNFATGQEYNEIPGAFYSGFNNDDEEYITIPNPIDGEYKIELQGTDNGGEYGVLTSLISEATSTTNQIIGITKPNQITELKTNVSDQAITQTERVITLEVFKNDINGAFDLGWIKDKKTRDSLIKQVEGAVKLQKRIETIYEKLPNGKKKEKRIEKIELKVNKILLKLFEKELDLLFKKNKITQDALDLLKLDIQYLLNNN